MTSIDYPFSHKHHLYTEALPYSVGDNGKSMKLKYEVQKYIKDSNFDCTVVDTDVIDAAEKLAYQFIKNAVSVGVFY